MFFFTVVQLVRFHFISGERRLRGVYPAPHHCRAGCCLGGPFFVFLSGQQDIDVVQQQCMRVLPRLLTLYFRDWGYDPR